MSSAPCVQSDPKLFQSFSDWVLGTVGRGLRPTRAGKSLSAVGIHILSINTEVALGAAVNSAAVFERLKTGRPDVELSVVCNDLFGDLLRFSPHVDRLLIVEAQLRTPVRTLFEFLGPRAEFARGVDCLLLNVWNQRLAAEIPSLAFRCCTRIGGGRLLSEHIRYPNDPAKSYLDNNLAILKYLGIENVAQEPHVYYSPEVLSEAKDRICAVFLDRPVVAFMTQTSGGQPSRWFDDRFIQLADFLANMREFGVLFLGGISDRAAINKIRGAMRAKSHSFAGDTSIPQLAAVISQCDLVVTLDSGGMHVARGTRTPAVVIASAWQPMHIWLPVGVNSMRVIRKQIDRCPDCNINICEFRECMDEIDVQAVITEIDGLLDDFPPSAKNREMRGELGVSYKSPDIQILSVCPEKKLGEISDL